MTGFEWTGISLWWLIPVVMMVLCFFMMTRGGGCMGFGSRNHRHAANGHGGDESAGEILDRRYASGEINGSEYEEMKRRIKSGGNGTG